MTRVGTGENVPRDCSNKNLLWLSVSTVDRQMKGPVTLEHLTAPLWQHPLHIRKSEAQILHAQDSREGSQRTGKFKPNTALDNADDCYRLHNKEPVNRKPVSAICQNAHLAVINGKKAIISASVVLTASGGQITQYCCLCICSILKTLGFDSEK